MQPNNRVNNIVDEINTYFKTLFKNEASLIWFGSWVRGDAYLQSDIDLAINHNKLLNKEQMLKFWQYVDEFPTLYKIDLVDIANADSSLKQQIFKDGKVL
jgi:predicted nucleotidyltransferase